MADELLGKANDEFVSENYQKALDLYTEALQVEVNRDDIHCNRAQAYLKLDRFKEALEDASEAINLNKNNQKAYLRKGTALFYLEDFLEAKEVFLEGQKLDPENNNFKTWIRKCEAELDMKAQETPEAKVKVGSSNGTPGAPDQAKGSQTDTAPKEAKASAPSPQELSKPPVTVQKEKYRHEWYQTATHVVVTILLKNVQQENLTSVIEENMVQVTVKLPEESDYHLKLDLAHPVVPSQSITKVLKSKIEIKLKKFEGIQWAKLEGAATAEVKPVMSNPVAQYPSSSHYTRNWDKLAQEVAEEEKTEKKEGDAALNDLFQKIYADGSDETKKAMAKSFYESGGTVLSTNWGEVGKDKVEVKPPDGMEYKPWNT